MKNKNLDFKKVLHRSTESVSDHLGNEYPSQKDMCEAYGVDIGTFRSRIKHGASIEEALTTPLGGIRGVPHTDHLGNVYPSKKAMCEAYGLSPKALDSRIKAKWSLEDALTIPVNVIKTPQRAVCFDHLGNEYPSKTALCRAYNIERATFNHRLENGLSLEEALTTPVTNKSGYTCKDHLGNEYDSIEAMCYAYDIEQCTYSSRIKRGMSVEEALTTPSKVIIKDHLGTVYLTKDAMCKAWGIERSTYSIRIRKGMSVEEALTTPLGSKGLKKASACKDHLGNEYPSRDAMCEAYNIDTGTFWSRISRGIGLEQALTTPAGELNQNYCIDHLGNKYPSQRAMCRAYNIGASTFLNRIAKGLTLEEALTTPIIKRK